MVYLRLGYPFWFIYRLWIPLFVGTEGHDLIRLCLSLVYHSCPKLTRAVPQPLVLHRNHCARAQEALLRAVSVH
eukprot:3795380-Pyramimonas_sp.AAC.1